MSDNVKLIDQNLIETFKYFGLKEKQIDNARYYKINTGCNHALWNMIMLSDKVNTAQMDRMEETFKTQRLPFAWWIDEQNISPEMRERFETDKYTDFGDIPGMIYELKDYQEQLNDKNVKC